MGKNKSIPRRDFLKQAVVTVGAATHVGGWPAFGEGRVPAPVGRNHQELPSENGISYPRVFRGSALKMLSFPLGGVAAGSLGLGGRGQLRDWEIFNRPNQGYSPAYAFPAIWARLAGQKPVARVLESRILPPYQGESGLGSNNVPGLSRLEEAEFVGEYPLAHIDFKDSTLPVSVSLDAFSPFIPHDPDDSGLPVAVLRYHLTNNHAVSAYAGIVFSIDNPVKASVGLGHASSESETRINEYRTVGKLAGLLMRNPGLATDDPMQGSFALTAVLAEGIRPSHWRGWPKGRWWNSPLVFWNAFSQNGALGKEPDAFSTVGALCQQVQIAPRTTSTLTFILSWNFPNRTPNWCGWDAPKGKGDTRIGNYYATRFHDAWESAHYAAQNLDRLESLTRLFARSFRESTVPDVVKEAASANLSTLASTTCFRTADGEFHGFEGSNNTLGCCFGNCTHVWNYETTTTFLFPSFARSLREAAFGYSMDDRGGMRFRQLLPDGYQRWGTVAADGQMGQIVHAYMDWKVSGDNKWARSMWPRIKRAIAFAWEPHSWDPTRRGVLSGVQHNTYDVEFYGPNPMCGAWYLAALRACEEMARAFEGENSAARYHELFEKGSKWIDDNLFNGNYFIQRIVGYAPDQIAPHLQGGGGAEDTEHPQYQLGFGCLVDQLVGQYLAHTAGLGMLLSPENVRATLESLYRYNYKRTLYYHDNVERTFALNDEAALVICDYATVPRPRIPFPYFEEVMTGFEHSAAALMIYSGMVKEGIECIGNIRARYDGVKRNAWDEVECGHHYVRAMAAWTSFAALSGFSYDGPKAAVAATPTVFGPGFRCFWSTGTGWGTYSLCSSRSGIQFSLEVLMGTLPCNSCRIAGVGSLTSTRIDGKSLPHTCHSSDGETTFRFRHPLVLAEGSKLQLEVLG